jgi:hypothetical protein
LLVVITNSRRSLVIRCLAGAVLALVAGLMLLSPAFAQDDDVGELEDLKTEREQVLEDAVLATAKIDVVTATVDEVSAALDELEMFVNIQEIRLEEAQNAYDAAILAIDEAQLARVRVSEETAAVKAHLTNLAVSSFTGEGASGGDDLTELILSDDPGESVRFMHLLELQTGSLGDAIDRLRALEIDAEQLVEAEQVAVDQAAKSLEKVDGRVAELDIALGAQEKVVTGAQIRLEAQLAEAAILQERDVELATKIRDQQESINRRVAVSARENGVEIPAPVDLEQIVQLDFFEDIPEPTSADDVPDGDDGELSPPPEAFFSIEVHEDIAEQTKLLFEEAFEAGLDLAGWGYRPIQLQIELRAAHCGGSEYDIWHKPVFECAPPTARPGFSKHEQGRAVDFTMNGSSIQTQDNPAFVWLTKHAPRYGFVNLPSEPWHWSLARGDEKLPAS